MIAEQLTNGVNQSLTFRCSYVRMTTPGTPPFDYDKFDAEAAQAVIAMGDGLARTICIARVLVENGRTIDLAGLDRGVGLLCAKALDLPAEIGRSVRPNLIALIAEVDRLTVALQAQP